MLQRAVHPGEILKDELAEIGVTPTELARQIDVPADRMSQIINAKRSITGDTALRLAHWFEIDPEFWMNLQARFDLVAADRAAGEAVKSIPHSPGPPGGADVPPPGPGAAP